MAYTQKRFPNDEMEFPTPPLWLVWNSDIVYDDAAFNGRTWDHTNLRTTGTGQVRHQPTLEKAKRNVHTKGHATGDRKQNTFWSDWAIYHWEDNKYVLKYEGRQGEPVKDHPLWQKGVAKDGTIGEPRDLMEDEVQAALASIANVSIVRQAARQNGIAI